MIPLGDEYKPRKFPFMNYTLISLNVIIFLYFFLQGFRRFIKALSVYGMIPAYVINGERVWTILTSMFMHGSLDHLLGNMLYLYIFGDNIEDVMGHFRYLIFYLVSGIVASMIHIIMLPPIPMSWRMPAVGASGAISGILGAYMVFFPYIRVKMLALTWWGYAIVAVPAYYFIGVWFFYQLYAGTWALLGVPSGIAFWAHVGGFITGYLIAKAYQKVVRRKRVYLVNFYPKVYRIRVE